MNLKIDNVKWGKQQQTPNYLPVTLPHPRPLKTHRHQWPDHRQGWRENKPTTKEGTWTQVNINNPTKAEWGKKKPTKNQKTIKQQNKTPISGCARWENALPASKELGSTSSKGI